MKILFTGKRNFDYNRTEILIKGLKALNIEIEVFPLKKKNRTEGQKLRAKALNADYVFIPAFRHPDVRYVKKHSVNTPVVFDPIISKYLSKVYDHGQWWKGPIKYWVDRLSFKAADILLSDTKHHEKYFIEKYKLPKERVHALHIGTEIPENIVSSNPNEAFTVGFYGNQLPLQGVHNTIQAAELLKHETGISFKFIGNHEGSSAYRLAKSLNLANLEFIPFLPKKELFETIRGFSICLGIFGNSIKAKSVVPNKAFHYAAFGKAILSKDTTGIKEVFTHGQDIHLCDGSPQSIADAILKLKDDESYRDSLGQNARILMEQKYSPKRTAEKFLEILRNTPI